MAERQRIIEVKNGNGTAAIVMAKGLTAEDMESLNKMFGENLSFKPDKKEDTVEIRATSPGDNAVHIAAELEDMGYLWKNSKNLGCRPVPSAVRIGSRARV